MEEVNLTLSFCVLNTKVAGTATLIFTESFHPTARNNKHWKITLNTEISGRNGINIPVRVASDKQATVEISNLLKHLYEIVAIQPLETETVIELKCLNVPTTEFIQNGALPDLLEKIFDRDPLLTTFQPSYISQILLKVTVVIKDLDETETSGQYGGSVNIQIGDNCIKRLDLKNVSYCHQVGDGNTIVVNIENKDHSCISLSAEGRMVIKICSKDKEWPELEEEIILNTEQAKTAINNVLEKYNIKLEHIKVGCIIFVIQLLKEKDIQNVLQENGPVMNLFRAIGEAGYWNDTLKRMKKKGVVPVFSAEVCPFSPDIPGDVVNYPVVDSTTCNDKEQHAFNDEQTKYKINMIFGDSFREDLKWIFKDKKSFTVRITTTVIEPKGISFSPTEEQLENADLSKVNTFLQKYGLHLKLIRKGSLLFDFCMSTQINEKTFMQASQGVFQELFQHNAGFLGEIKVLEMKLELATSGVTMQNDKSLELTLYPVSKVREAVAKGLLPDVIQSIIGTWNPKHLQKIKGINVEVSTCEKQDSKHCNLEKFLQKQTQKFVKTESYHEVRRMLKEENIVTINGGPGTGKSIIAHNLVFEAMELGFEAQILCSPEELETKIDLQKKQILLFDDFIGHNFLCPCKADAFLEILPRMRRYVCQRSGSLKVIIVSRSHVMNIGLQYLKLNNCTDSLKIVNICKMLSVTEKKDILHKILPSETYEEEYGECSSGHFQQCVQLFSSISLSEPLFRFMKNPSEQLETHIEKMREESKLEFMCLLILAIQGGEIMADKLFDINVFGNDKDLLESICGVDYDEEKILQSFKNHKSGYINVCCSRFRFSHLFVFKAVLRVIEKVMNNDKGTIIMRLPFNFLERHVTCKTNQDKKLKVLLDKCNFPIIAKRFVEEITKGNVQRISRHKILENEDFISRFIEECKSCPLSLVTCERDNRNRNLFNGSILYWISVENSAQCLLQILDANLFDKETDKFWLKMQLSGSLIQACCRGMSCDIVQKLVSFGADLQCSMNTTNVYGHFNCDQCTVYDKTGMTAIGAVVSSAADDNRNALLEFLLEHDIPNLINIPDVLSMIIKNGYTNDVLRTLMKKITNGSEIIIEKFNLVTSLTSPLWIALEAQNEKAFSTLVEFGLRTDIENEDGETLFSKCPESFRKLYFKSEDTVSQRKRVSPVEKRKQSVDFPSEVIQEDLLKYKDSVTDIASVASLEVYKPNSYFASLKSDIGSDSNDTSLDLNAFEILQRKPSGDILIEFQKKLSDSVIKSIDEEGNTLLLVACGESYIDFEKPSVKSEIISLLLKNGCSIQHHNKRHENVFHRILRSLHTGKLGIFFDLMDRPGIENLLLKEDYSGFTPFHLLCSVDYTYDEAKLELAVQRLIKIVGLKTKSISLLAVACSKNINTAHQLLKLGCVVTERDFQHHVSIFKDTPFDAHFLAGSDILLFNTTETEKARFKSWISAQTSFAYHYFVLFCERKINIDEKRQHFHRLIESENNGQVCIKAIKVLLRHVDLNKVVDDCGRSFLMNTFFHFNAKGRGIVDVVKFLLEKSDHLNVEDEVGHGLLYYCVNSNISEDNIMKCLKLLRECGVEETKKDNVLLLAARRFMTNTVEYLINNGVSINQRDSKGRNALHHVIMSNYVSHHLRVKFEPLVRLLIRQKINVNCQDSESLTPLQYLVGMHACVFDDTTKDEFLYTCLKSQSRCDYHAGYHHFVRYLVHCGADHNVVDKLDQTLLHLATNKMNKDSYKTFIYLLELGLDINARNKDGETPLHLITKIPEDDVVWCTGLRLPILQLLIKRGSIINIRDNSGQTPLHKVVNHYVEFWKHDKNECRLMKAHTLLLMAHVLICHGVDLTLVDLKGASVKGILEGSDTPFLKMIINQEKAPEEILDLVTRKLRDSTSPDACVP